MKRPHREAVTIRRHELLYYLARTAHRQHEPIMQHVRASWREELRRLTPFRRTR